MPAAEASAFNQALMDLGATICLPRRPLCGACPLRRGCRARQLGATGRIPLLPARREAVSVSLVAVAVRRGDDCLLVKRDAGRLMGGMWEFPSGKSAGTEAAARRLAGRLRASGPRPVGEIRHTITHHRIRIKVYQASPAARRGRASGERWACLEEVAAGRSGLAVTGSARKIARLLAGRSS
jgi:A/G-specific adenine glycosylase